MKFLVTTAGVLALASGAFATDLWNQQTGVSGTGDQPIENSFTDVPSFSTYGVSDVVASSAWTIQSISLLVISNSPGSALTINSATLNIFAGTGAGSPTAANNPTTGSTVSVTTTAVAGNASEFLVTASGLNISVAKGEYWIGLTPTTSYSQQGEVYGVAGTTNPAGATAFTNYRNPGGGFGMGTGWVTGTSLSTGINAYEAIDIQGVVPAPEPISTAIVIGALGTAVAKRRKRS